MDASRGPRQILADIWAEFRKARYENEQEIIEYLAYLLTRDLPPLDRPLRMERPRTRYGVDEEAVWRFLEEARALLEGSGGLATFFDRYILFYPTRLWRKDTYPIPRHLVQFMLAILQIESRHRFADFTCGQGGFLVNKGGQNRAYPGEAVGNEISMEMGRLAYANAVLHGLQSVRITVGNAFGVSEFIHDSFDRIAMAPPFDGTVEARLVQPLFPDRPDISDRSNRLLFTRLALRQLKQGGQAALLVPDGLLHNGGASRQLREELINEHAVKAVVTFQAGMFQPYVSNPMYMLLFQRGPVSQSPLMWFVRLANDGYPLNANRDLTTEPSQESDLPLAQAAILSRTDEKESFQPLLDEKQDAEYTGQPLFYKPLPGNLKGIILQIQPDVILDSIHYLSVEKDGSYLVIQARFHGAPAHLALAFSNGNIDIARNRTHRDLQKWKRTLFPAANDEDLPDGRYIFGAGVANQRIAITPEGNLLGFTKTREEIAEAGYQFSDIYWKQHAILPPESVTTTEMLQRIRSNQRRINSYAESLQGQLAVKHLLTRSLPPSVLAVDQFPLLASLGDEQQDIWKQIEQQVVPVNQAVTTARHFRPEDLPHYAKEPIKVLQSLQLFECLGLIVQVTFADSMCYYRRATELDLPESVPVEPALSESE